MLLGVSVFPVYRGQCRSSGSPEGWAPEQGPQSWGGLGTPQASRSLGHLTVTRGCRAGVGAGVKFVEANV